MFPGIWKKRYKSRKINGVYWSLEQALEYLASARKFGIRPGLERIEQLLERLGNPQNACPAIHIAGTNGKGSISSMLAYIAATANFRTGIFTSPYLTNFNERIRLIEGKEGLQKLYKDNRSSEISNDDIAKTMMLIAYEVEIMNVKGFAMPTEFELLTAAAFVYFAEMDCDLIIIETGMGGRLDSTNLIEKPLATIVSALGYDHINRLGGTISEIAREKAGIMRPEVPTYVYNPHDTELDLADAKAAEEVFMNSAEELKSPLHFVNRSDIIYESSYLTGQTFTYKNQGPFHIQLGGDYQAQNAALAVEVGRLITDDVTIKEGIALAKWPGRLECISQAPFIMVDGAHNKQGVYGLKKHLEKFLKHQKLVLLMGVLSEKDYQSMVEIICDSNLYDLVEIVCTIPDFPSALPAEELAGVFRDHLNKTAGTLDYTVQEIVDLDSMDSQSSPNTKVRFSSNNKLAAQYAYEIGRRNHYSLIAFGSLYLIGEIRTFLMDLLEGSDI